MQFGHPPGTEHPFHHYQHQQYGLAEFIHFHSQQYGRAGRIPFHQHQYGRAGCTLFLNAGISDCPASGQSGTGMKKNAYARISPVPESGDPVRYRNAPVRD